MAVTNRAPTWWIFSWTTQPLRNKLTFSQHVFFTYRPLDSKSKHFLRSTFANATDADFKSFIWIMSDTLNQVTGEYPCSRLNTLLQSPMFWGGGKFLNSKLQHRKVWYPWFHAHPLLSAYWTSPWLCKSLPRITLYRYAIFFSANEDCISANHMARILIWLRISLTSRKHLQYVYAHVHVHTMYLKYAPYDWLKYLGMAILVCRKKNRYRYSKLACQVWQIHTYRPWCALSSELNQWKPILQAFLKWNSQTASWLAIHSSFEKLFCDSVTHCAIVEKPLLSASAARKFIYTAGNQITSYFCEYFLYNLH